MRSLSRTTAAVREEFEYELLDTGIFDEDRYFDVFVEYAKADPEDLLIRITVHNRGPEAGRFICFRPSGFAITGQATRASPMRQVEEGSVLASHTQLGDCTIECDGNPELLFTENETNAERLWGQPNASP